jgi:drug/metabolite transporter (DMT)-like permease
LTIPAPIRFLLALLVAFAIGVALLFAAGGSRGGHPFMIVAGIAIALLGLWLLILLLRPLSRPRGEEEDVFEGGRGLFWSLVILIVLMMIGFGFFIVFNHDALRGFIDGWNGT